MSEARNRFDEVSGVERRGDGRHVGHIAPGWDIAGNANGGYLLAMAARASGEVVGRPPVTITAHYLAPGRPGAVEIDTTVIRSGVRFATVATTLRTEQTTLVTALGSYADPATIGGTDPPELVTATPPDLPAVESCVAIRSAEAGEIFPPPFVDRIELRLHPDDAAMPVGAARIRGWFRLRDGEPVDAYGLLLAADAFPPPVFNAGLPVTWTPTIELTAHVRGTPAPGWLACSFRSRLITGGLTESDAEIWDGDGRPVAQARQLALLTRPAPRR